MLLFRMAFVTLSSISIPESFCDDLLDLSFSYFSYSFAGLGFRNTAVFGITRLVPPFFCVSFLHEGTSCIW